MRTQALRIISLVVFCTFIVATCKKDDPVTALVITDITAVDNSVKINGTITSLSGNKNSEFGVCYGTKNTPLATDTTFRLGLPKIGNFSAEIKDLKRNKTYYFRAYIKEGDTYLYDEVKSSAIIAIAPVASTSAASSITETTVTLNASVNPNASTTTVSFEYGLTTSYGSTVAATQNIISGSTSTNVGAGITSLTANTTYHFRVKAINAAGTVMGSDMTFTTLANLVAPSATSSSATSVSNTSVTLNGSVNPNGTTTTISFEYGTTFVYGTLINATPGSLNGITPTTVTAALTGLTPGQLYHFRIKAVSGGGTTYGEDITFTTTQPPAATSSVATNLTLTTATLNGIVNANGLSTAISFEYGTSASYGTTIAGVPGNATVTGNTSVSADITGLGMNTTYHFRVKAASSAGTTNGVDLSFTTSAPMPVLTTSAATSLTSTAATSGGNITSDGGAAITERGVCWSTSANPTISNTHTSNGPGTGFFSSSIIGLSPSTMYYIRAYATNAAITAYGDQVSFTTLATDPVIPTLTTSIVTAITKNTATGGGNISNDGGATVTSRGICFSTALNPTIDDSKTINGTGTGIFTSPFTGLNPGTLYHIRAYATNLAGTAYGNDLTFTSLPPDPVLPTVATSLLSEISSTNATGGGNVTNDGGGAVTARGVCWSTSEKPTTSDWRTINSSGTGIYVSSITGLSASTIYYVRAYATNSAGTAYGDQVDFTTSDPPAVLATLTTVSVSGITSSTASTGGNISNDGGGSITERGVCWSTTVNPTIAGSRTSDGPGSGTFSSYISGLNLSTLYYVRSYATNAAGTAYGNQISFTTADVLPSITTTAITGITSSSASSGGNITGSITGVTARGVCWSTSTAPTIALGTKTSDGAGGGVFLSSIAGLTPCTVYFVRAYATNSVGTVYGNEISFTAGTSLPTLTTTTISGITSSGAISGGNITGSCAASVTARGVCWSTASNPTVALATKTINGSGGGTYSSNITGLTQVTTYYVRAYATNAAGTTYGNEVSFISLPNVPTISTSGLSIIASTEAVAGGNVIVDGGAAVTARGVCWSTATYPTIANSSVSGGSGIGSFTANMTGLAAGTTYYVRAYATNSAGTGYGGHAVITTPATLTDIDGNQYNTVSINGQIWMQSNLRATRYEDGTNLIQYSDTMTFGWSYYHAYNESATNLTSYGYLYNGYVVAGAKDICPVGWHIPTSTDWSTLSSNLGGYTVAGGKMNDLAGRFSTRFPYTWSNYYWNNSITGHSNSSLFYGRGGGYYFTSYADILNSTIWWVSTSKRYVRIDYNSTYLSGIGTLLYGNDDNSFYIRCKKD